MVHRSATLAICGLFLTSAAALAAEVPLGQPLLTTPINPTDLVTLDGNTRPEATHANDRGALPDDFALDHMHLQLKRSPAQETIVEAYVNALTERGSPTYHKWLTATEFGSRFGAAQVDVEKITTWLKGQGFAVNFVYPSHMVIDFSGTAGLVSKAFHVPMHRLNVDGVEHLANIKNPEIPLALAPVVAGIVSLNDFRARNQVRSRPSVTGCNGAATCPQYSLGAGDLATIYDIKRLFQQGNSGAGNTVAAVEPTDMFTAEDWAQFRAAFGLRAYPQGELVFLHPAPANGTACTDPGYNDDDVEATLDVEWISAAAPSAVVVLASCAATQTTDGLYLATQNLVNSTSAPPVISVSYTTCEADAGATANAAYNGVFQQAASEGISVFVAAGDTGSTNCTPNTGPASTAYGIGMNGLAVSQYSVAVGGTDFGDKYQGATQQYWRRNTGPPWSTAISYIPEIAWNNTCASPLLAAFNGFSVTYGSGGYCNATKAPLAIGGGGGGPSACYSGAPSVAHEVSGTCKGYPKPSWQTGVIGLTADGVRDLPDVAMFASDGAWSRALATCFTDTKNKTIAGKPCSGNPATWVNAGGTSYAAPIMAGIQVLVDSALGEAVGNPLPVYYKLAAAEYGSKGNAACYSTKGAAVGSACVFRDVVPIGAVADGNEMDCDGTYNCYRPSGSYGVQSTSNSAYKPGFSTGIGWDFVTGLGSVDAYNLVNSWPR